MAQGRRLSPTFINQVIVELAAMKSESKKNIGVINNRTVLLDL